MDRETRDTKGFPWVEREGKRGQGRGEGGEGRGGGGGGGARDGVMSNQTSEA